MFDRRLSLLPFILLCVPVYLSRFPLSHSPVRPSLSLCQFFPLPPVHNSPFRLYLSPIDGSSSVCEMRVHRGNREFRCCCVALRGRQRKTSGEPTWMTASPRRCQARSALSLRFVFIDALSRVLFIRFCNLCMRSARRSGWGGGGEYARTSERASERGVGNARREKNNTGQDVTRAVPPEALIERVPCVRVSANFSYGAFPVSFRSPAKPPFEEIAIAG